MPITCFLRFKLIAVVLSLASVGLASDHADSVLLNTLGRNDAKITDLYVFADGTDLIVLLSTNPSLPAHQVDCALMGDLRFRVRIDTDSDVGFDDAFDLAHFGGTVLHPARIKHEIELRVSAGDDHRPRLQVKGANRDDVGFAYGIFDDPFIRGPRQGRNIFGMAFRLPLADVLEESSTVLVWAVAEIDGATVEHGGRALRSQVGGNDLLNYLRPSKQARKLDMAPDVIIFDTSKPAVFPNGRALSDDVVDIIGVLGDGEVDLRATDGPSFPTENDLPFPNQFPYFAPPHP